MLQSIFIENLARNYLKIEKLDQKQILFRGGGRTFARHCRYKARLVAKGFTQTKGIGSLTHWINESMFQSLLSA